MGERVGVLYRNGMGGDAAAGCSVERLWGQHSHHSLHEQAPFGLLSAPPASPTGAGDLARGRAQVGCSPPPSLQGSGRYAIYIANYAHGNVGPDALIEMDPEASDLSRGILALRDVAAEAGVSKYTGMRGAQVGWEQGVGGPASWDLSPWSPHEAGVSREGHMSTLFDLLPLSPSVQWLVDSGRCKPQRTQ